MSSTVDQKHPPAGLVTGGAAGIGKATALRLGADGLRVVVADIDVVGGQQTVDEIVAAGGDAIFVECDVTDAASVEGLVNATVERYGSLDFAHNNAGVATVGQELHEITEEFWDRAISINLTSVWLCLKYQIPIMREQGHGSIVNTGSLAGVLSGPRKGAYNAAKAAVASLSKSAAIESASLNVRVNTVSPGWVLTEMVEQHTTEEERREGVKVVPLGRFATPEEVAATVAWFLSDESSYVTGQDLIVDGGICVLGPP